MLIIPVKNNYFFIHKRKMWVFNLEILLKSQINLFAFEIEEQKRFPF